MNAEKYLKLSNQYLNSLNEIEYLERKVVEYKSSLINIEIELENNKIESELLRQKMIYELENINE